MYPVETYSNSTFNYFILDIEEEDEDKNKGTGGSGCEYQGLCGCPAGFYPMVVYGQIQCIGKSIVFW